MNNKQIAKFILNRVHLLDQINNLQNKLSDYEEGTNKDIIIAKIIELKECLSKI